MTYGGQFLKISWLFQIIETDEIADTSMNYSVGPGWTGAAAALDEVDNGIGVLKDLYDLMPGLLDGNRFKWADYSELTGVKMAAIGTNGKYLKDPQLYAAPANTRGQQAAVLPQASVVISLRTESTLGKGNYGRMYLPHTSLPNEPFTPYASTLSTQQTADAASTFILDCFGVLNATITADVRPVIMSQAAGTPIRGITNVKVGNVTDTQRRRRNQLQETYASSQVSFP